MTQCSGCGVGSSIMDSVRSVIKAYAFERNDFTCNKDLFLIDCGDGREVYVCAEVLDEVEEFIERNKDRICR
jgi:hypothetical protein